MPTFAFTEAPKNWEIIQQKDGFADIAIKGNFEAADKDESAPIWVGLLDENDCSPVIEWQRAEKNGSEFSATLARVPAGGLYRIEVRFGAHRYSIPNDSAGQLAIHHIGVGDNYLIAGQSNSSGTGKGEAEATLDLMVHGLRDAKTWDIATNPLDIFNTKHAPWISFAKTLARKLGYPIGLIPTARGGSHLSRWLPDENKDLFENMVRVVKENKIGLKGILWYQGCAEAAEHLGDTYLARFGKFVRAAREAFELPDLPILTVQINRFVDGDKSEESLRHWSLVREAQRQAAEQIPGVFVTTAFDAHLSDGIHNGAPTNPMIGHRVAQQALHRIYGKGTCHDAGNISAAVRSEDGKEVKLSFANVMGIVEYGLATRSPFLFEDEKGSVAFESMKVALDSLTFTLSRPLVGRAYATYLYGSDFTHYFCDGANQIPLLAFYHYEIK